MTKRRKKELIQAWVAVGAVGVLWSVFSGEAILHELGHVVFVIAGGGQVTAFRMDHIRAIGASDLALYMGTGFAILARGLGMTWLLKRRRSVVLAAWLWGRMLAEWVSWWRSDLPDRHAMSSFQAAVTWTVIHGGATLVFVLATSYAAYRLIVAWNAADPKHIENPSLFHDRQMSRL